MVNAHKPATLQDAMDNTRYIQDVSPKTRCQPNINFPSKFKDKIHFQKGPSGNFKRDNFYKDHGELRRKKLCFSCQDNGFPTTNVIRGNNIILKKNYEC